MSLTITAVTTSVGYADIQRHTLPSLCAFADRVIVVTAPGDPAVDLARKCGAEVITSVDPHARGAKFNKSAMVRAGQMAAGTSPDDWTLIVDADVLIDPAQRYAARIHIRDRSPLYTCRRHTIRTPEDFRDGRYESSDSTVGLGYFQLYNPDGACKPLYDEWSHGADACDMTFKAKFPALIVLPFSVFHLGPTETNWFGRKSPRW